MKREKIDLKISFLRKKVINNIRIELYLISISFQDYSNFDYFSREVEGEVEAWWKMDDVRIDLKYKRNISFNFSN